MKIVAGSGDYCREAPRISASSVMRLLSETLLQVVIPAMAVEMRCERYTSDLEVLVAIRGILGG